MSGGKLVVVPTPENHLGSHVLWCAAESTRGVQWFKFLGETEVRDLSMGVHEEGRGMHHNGNGIAHMMRLGW